MFLVGDFNAYSHEDPIEVLDRRGLLELDSTTDPNEETYNFDGQIGLARPRASPTPRPTPT